MKNLIQRHQKKNYKKNQDQRKAKDHQTMKLNSISTSKKRKKQKKKKRKRRRQRSSKKKKSLKSKPVLSIQTHQRRKKSLFPPSKRTNIHQNFGSNL